MKSLPSISIITCTFGSNKQIFTRVLESIKMQNYPRNLIEHLVMDGGSKDGTVELAKKYKCKVYSDPKMKEQAEERASLGIKKAKHELIVFIQNDNILPSKFWFKQMVLPFTENKNVCCSFSAYNAYEKNMTNTTKYCALFGSSDPTLYYLGKSEKIRMDQKLYDKGIITEDKSGYWIVRFNGQNLPTIGDNGHMFLRRVINKVNKDPNTFVHVDAFKELLDKGYNEYAVVKNSIIHITTPSIKKLVDQRVKTKEKFFNGRKGHRAYLIMDWKSWHDRVNLLKYIIYSLTIVIPFLEALQGYFKIREKAWFLHPIACILMLWGYGISEIKMLFNGMNKKD